MTSPVAPVQAASPKRVKTRLLLVIPCAVVISLCTLALVWGNQGMAFGPSGAKVAVARILDDAASGRLADQPNAEALIGHTHHEFQTTWGGNSICVCSTVSESRGWWVEYEGTYSGPRGKGTFCLKLATRRTWNTIEERPPEDDYAWAKEQSPEKWKLQSLEVRPEK